MSRTAQYVPKNTTKSGLTSAVQTIIEQHVDANPDLITAIQVEDGSAAAPTISFASDTDTGFYRTTGVISATIDGTRVMDINASGLYLPRKKLILTGNTVTFSGPTATTGAVFESGHGQLFLDATSSGTVAQHNSHSFGYKNLSATLATTYTDSYTVYITGVPTVSTNVSLTNRYALGIANGTVINKGGGQMLFPLGTVALPTYSFNGDTNTGMYSSGADSIDFATNGVLRFTINNNGITSTGQSVFPLGTVAAPPITFSGDLDTGIYSSAADNVDIATNGVQRMNVSNSGVKIGTNGTSISETRTGTASTGAVAANTINTIVVSFSPAFSTAPKMFGNVQTTLAGANNQNQLVVTFESITTTGCVIDVFNPSATTATSNTCVVAWLAMV